MLSSRAYRTAGLVALCLLVGVLSGALGGAQQQQPLPQYQVIVKGDPEFAPLVDLVNPIILKAVHSLDDGDWPWIGSVQECGSTIAIILGVMWSRKGNGFELSPIGSLRAQETLSLGGKGEFPTGKYFFWLGHTKGLQIQPPPGLEMGWFMAMTDPQKEIVAFLLARWDGPEPEEVWSNEMLLALVAPRNAIPSIPLIAAGPGYCDLTVQHLSVTARKFSSLMATRSGGTSPCRRPSPTSAKKM